jgi:hypothetical protein
MDLPGKLVMTFVLVLSLWQLALPLWPLVQDATLQRFQLRTNNFVLWAMQQCIPSMYSFENRYWVYDQDPRLTAPGEQVAEALESRLINHFPTRVFTFGDNRFRFLTQGFTPGESERFLLIRSSYRGRECQTLCQITADTAGQLHWQATNFTGETP